MSLLFICIKQKSNINILIILVDFYLNLVDFYVNLSRFFCYPDPDPRYLKWIRIWPNEVEPGGSATLRTGHCEILYGRCEMLLGRCYNMLSVHCEMLSGRCYNMLSVRCEMLSGSRDFTISARYMEYYLF